MTPPRPFSTESLSHQRPNIVLIMLDDLGFVSVSHMPAVNQFLADAGATGVGYLGSGYRQQLETLQAADEMIRGVVAEPRELGVLESTYLLFLSGDQCRRLEDQPLPAFDAA